MNPLTRARIAELVALEARENDSGHSYVMLRYDELNAFLAAASLVADLAEEQSCQCGRGIMCVGCRARALVTP